MSQLPTPNKPLPTIPRPSTSSRFLSSVAEWEDRNDIAFLPSADSSERLDETGTSDTTRRDYALLELLNSERTYASDLILIRDYQIPLASGRLSSISSIWPISGSETMIRRYPGLATSDTHSILPGPSTAGVSRPLTTASEVSAMSLDSIFTLRPMKTKDINIVFGNVEDLAAFSETFLYQLESALGEFIEGNEGEDYVGRFFLDFIPQMEPLYTKYIMNQPHALEHYHKLSQTFQFDVYHPRAEILAHKCSQAWDLPSLLIKPVQRLLHYPSLLAAIIETTPDSHGDKANLVAAHARMGELARGLNARWRQQEVVHDVLASAGVSDTARGGHEAAKARSHSEGGRKVGLATSVNLGRIIKPRSVMGKAKEGPNASAEAEAVKAMGERLRSYEPFMIRLAKETIDWVDAMHVLVGALKEWGESFSRMLLMDNGERHLAALEAFLDPIGYWSMAACRELKAEIENTVLRAIDALQRTMGAPMRLLEAMRTSSPNLRLGPAASESYVALRAQLFAELPRYLTLLDRGVAACILGFAHTQQRFYDAIRDMWTTLWASLNSEDMANHWPSGAEETLRGWSHRFSAAEARVTSLGIVQQYGERLPLAKPCTGTGERLTDDDLQGASSVPLAAILATLQQSRHGSRAIRRRAAPSYYPAFNVTRPTVYPMETELLEDEEALHSEWRATNRFKYNAPREPSCSSREHLDADKRIVCTTSNALGGNSVPGTTRLDENRRVGVVFEEEEIAQPQPHVPLNVRLLTRLLAVVEEESTSDLDDPDCVGTMGIPNQDAGTITPQTPVVRHNDPLADVSEPVKMTMAAYAKHEAATNAKLGTRLIHHPPSRAPSDSASRQTPYAREPSASAKLGTRLGHAYGPSPPGPSTPSPASRRMPNTTRQSSANAKFGTRLVSESHSAPRPASRRTAVTSVNGKAMPHSHEGRSKGNITTREPPPPWARAIANPGPLAHQDSDHVSDADSEDSGIGLYREICNPNR